MKVIRPVILTILYGGTLLFFFGSFSWGILRDPGLSETEIRKSWKAFEKIKDSTRVQGDYPYMICFKQTARKYDLPLPLLLAVARGESNFDRKAKSDRECYGIMQIRWPGTANDLGIFKKSHLLDPCKNIDAGGKYLSQLLKRFKDDTFLALASYNYGPNRIQREIRSNKVPEGAQWYAAYIYNHLQFIISKIYEKTQRLLVFEYTYYRTAVKYRKVFEDSAPGVPFEIFKSNKYTYDIYITYRTSKERKKYVQRFMDKTGIKPLGLKK